MFSVLVIRLRSLRLLRVSGIVMRLRMFLLLITFLKASHSFRNRLLVICKNAYLFATMIMTSVSSPFSCCSGKIGRRFSRNAETDLVCRLLLEKKKNTTRDVEPRSNEDMTHKHATGLPALGEQFHSTPVCYVIIHSLHCLFFFNHTATTDIYTLSLHDALPICFPFIQEPPSGDLQERVLIRHHDYDQCFQSVQLLQWNSQVKFNVTVYRNLPTTRDSIMTS